MKQILLITDGCSNVGQSPVMTASYARQEGITVNVIGVVDYGTIGELGSLEIREIAKAGGGMSQITGTQNLGRTMQMMTRKTVVQTIQQAVNKELRQILGSSGVENLSPDKRAEVVEVMEELAETSTLEVALLIDASASMKPKLAFVEEAIRDLMLSLGAREGLSRICVFHFPGRHGGEEVVMDVDWSTNIQDIRTIFQRMNMRGATPTGPAMVRVIDFLRYGTLNGNGNHTRPEDNHEREGLLGDYVV
ncbi:Ca-activated chloride channel family protein [Paenibacillus shirakamiensis]|uniref:Ca-activated chloride channel family protein n=1 Tax=Paenibacillus shirakamiensis TaxID=1265935 RepID=A0ABS4JLX7_9BACL|nr:VWA domain-containing protein [Paenibacillus shirakamiensis]MBP2002718.1 Ca-activated chloride channel family protein [Paenibacillus shirakamiensis]